MPLKLQYASDLHLEFPVNKEFLKQHPLQPVGDVLVLAGDIVPFALTDKNQDFFRYVADNFETTYWLPGNHEYYHHDIDILDDHLFELAARKNLNYLQRTSVVIQGVRFLGCTLWTDFNIQPGWRFGAELVAKAFLPDYKLIRMRGKQFSPSMGIDLHHQNIDWLESALAMPFDGRMSTRWTSFQVTSPSNLPSSFCGRQGSARVAPGSSSGASRMRVEGE